jgi:hypothetical protein
MEGSHPFWINPNERAGPAPLSVEICAGAGSPVSRLDSGSSFFSQLDVRPQFIAQLAVLRQR